MKEAAQHIDDLSAKLAALDLDIREKEDEIQGLQVRGGMWKREREWERGCCQLWPEGCKEKEGGGCLCSVQSSFLCRAALM